MVKPRASLPTVTGRRAARLLVLAMYGILGLALIAFLAPNTFVGADLEVYQRASRDLLEHGNPYYSAPAHLYQFQYRYPPLLAMLVVVLGWEPLWYGLMAAATGWSLLAFVRQTGPAGFLPIVVLSGAWGQTLLNGNVQPAMMALLALVPVYRRMGAVALAVATMLKLHPVLGVVWYAGRRDWVALRWYALAVVALLLVQAPWLDTFLSFYLTDQLASPFGQAGFGLRTIHPALWVAGITLMAVLAYRYANSRAGWLLNIGLQLVALPRLLLANLALLLAAPLHPRPKETDA
jgi:hypothetical protein